MSTSPVKVGIVGLGRWAKVLTRAAKQSDKINIVAGYSRSADTRAAFEKELGVPAYVVFHDATLAELARMRPQTEAALAQISGVGTRKLERYGAALLELLQD